MRIITLRVAIDTCMARRGFYGLSFFGDNDLDVEAITRLAASNLDHGQIRLSTVGRIRGVGFDPYRSGEYPHLSVRFELNPTDDELERLVSAFDDPIPNPLKSS